MRNLTKWELLDIVLNDPKLFLDYIEEGCVTTDPEGEHVVTVLRDFAEWMEDNE